MLRLKEGDTALPINGKITSAAAGNPPRDLTGCTVVATLVAADTREILLSRPVAIVDATGGAWRLDWQDGETSRPGKYFLEISVTFPDGHVAHAPTDGFLTVLIEQALA